MNRDSIINKNLDQILLLIKSNSSNKLIYEVFPKIIRKNFKYISEDSDDQAIDDKEGKEYKRLLNFFKELIILKKIDLLKIGLETAYDIDEHINMILYDIGPTFFKNKMLKEYYEIVTEFNNNKYFIDEALTEEIADMFFDIEPDNIYYLILETSIFAIENRHYELMKFIVNTWNSKDNEFTINFSTKGMSNNDMEKTLYTLNLLNDIIDKKFNASK